MSLVSDGPPVYLAHSKADEAAAKQLATALRGHQIRVWLPEWDIELGDVVVSKHEEAMAQAAISLLLFSRQGLVDPWLNQLYVSVCTKAVGHRGQVIPVLDGITVDDLPPLLASRKPAAIDDVLAIATVIKQAIGHGRAGGPSEGSEATRDHTLRTRPMLADEAHQVLHGMAVDGWPGVYLLGCVDRRVTLYNQQVRALNLAAALVASERVKAGENVVVVGAGTAGLTCAAGLGRLGAAVTVLERQGTILPLFHGNSSRWLHPRVYDWPLDGWDRDRAGLPLLDWEHGPVDAVRQQLEAAWSAWSNGISVLCDVGQVRLGQKGDVRRKVTWAPSGSLRTNTVILAVGFGLEPATPRYWETDDLDLAPVDGRSRKWLVSGCGDSGLTDLCRLCIDGFRQHEMLRDFTADSRMHGICEQIRRIENDAAIQDDPAKLHDAYAQLHAPWAEASIKARARRHSVKLAAPTADFLTRGASPLNRFLAGQLHRVGAFELVPSRVARCSPAGEGVAVFFEDGTTDYFDRIIERHGPESGLEKGFPGIAQAIASDRPLHHAQPALTNHTRSRFWIDGAFGPETRDVTSRSARRPRLLPPTGSTIVSTSHGVSLVRIPDGTFLMGSAADDATALNNEKPPRWVDVASFHLARTPVTNAEYRKFLKDPQRGTEAREPACWRDGRFNRPRQPVVGITWDEAQAYCRWAGLRLPTEAEWEYACRAGTTTRYWSGNDEQDLRRAGWYAGNSGGWLHVVGELEPNPFGLYDMHGNVFEWCEDSWDAPAEPEMDEPSMEPDTRGDAPARVVRGGHYAIMASHARSAFRLAFAPELRWNAVGFRPAASG